MIFKCYNLSYVLHFMALKYLKSNDVLLLLNLQFHKKAFFFFLINQTCHDLLTLCLDQGICWGYVEADNIYDV